MSSFFHELKRRNVYKVGAAYAVVAWLLIQLASILFPTFEAPGWVMKVFVALIAGGFPIALVLAWAFELTPEGIQRTGEAGAVPNRQRSRWIVLVALAAVAAAGLAAWQWQSRPGERRSAGGAMPQASPAAEMKSVAVLPFVNMSGDPANEYFSDGITEEILNAIAHIPDLRVASRTSAFAYKGRNEDIGEIAKSLRVNIVLEGSVQRMGDRVRITAQLIDATSGYHLWSKRYDRETKDLFAVQDEIAQSIARTLKLELTSGGKERAQRSGTGNTESHEAYLKALEAFAAGGPEARQQALGLVDQAIALDPKFAAAYALKAEILSSLAFGTADEASYARYIELGAAAARRAMELNPELAEAHAALGEIARRRGEDGVALEHLERAAKLKPADPDIWQSLGLASMGRDAADALRFFLKSKELGSTSLYIPRQISYALDALGRLDEAYATIRDHHAAHPDHVPTTLDLGRFELWARGRPDRALKYFAEAYRQSPTFVDGGVPVSFYPALVYAISGHRDEASAWLARQTATAPDSVPVAITQLLLGAPAGDRQTLAWLTKRPGDNTLAAARTYRLRAAADAALLAAEYELAVDLHRELLTPEAAGVARYNMRRRRHELKLAYALRKLGRNEEADPLLQETPDSFASTGRYSFSVWTTQPSAGIFYTDGELYALRGEKAKSLQALNATLGLPDDGLISFGSLPVPIENSPLLESLRGDPGFDAFRQEVARRRAIMKSRVRAATEQLGIAQE